jgi:type IV pilus assembly protein PilQ
MKKSQLIITLLCCTFSMICSTSIKAQDRFVSIENQLQALAVDMPGLEDKVDLSVNGVSIEEFIRGLAITNKLNISVDPTLETKIVNNFSGVTVTDVLLFLAKEHDLAIGFTGSIISISKYRPPVEKPKPIPPRLPQLSYSSPNQLLSLDLKNDSLDAVAREITSKTGKNVVLAAGIGGMPVSCFIKDMPFDNAIEKFAFANNLMVEKTEDNFYLISPAFSETDAKNPARTNNRNTRGRNNRNQNNDAIEMDLVSINNISLHAVDIPIVDIIKSVSEELEISYFLNSAINGNTTISVKNTTYNDLLNHLLNATTYTYQQQGDVFIFGERKIEKLRDTKLIQLQHRSIENVIPNIPKELVAGVDIKEFPDLNSLILSGSKPNIEEIAAFLKHIDKVVPVVLIEVLLIDYRTDRAVSAGVRVGIGKEKAAASSGSIFPDLKYDFNSESVNNIIQNLNGNGFLNLGRVTPNFYMSINALEEEGLLRVRSTPKLATLNGTEATLSIGNTEYYIVESNNVIGSQNPQNIITRQYQSVNADLSVTIKPFVSGDDQITLDIQVEQSDFTARISPDAPPGSVTRSFSSLLRVKNEEMILLGGLEQRSVRNSGSGVPLLSRIPVIKWLFSNRTREKSKSRLNIFIKPTVLY